MSSARSLILLFLPFFLNIVIDRVIWFQVPYSLWSENPREAQIIFTSLLQTYGSPLMSLIQVSFGFYAIRILGGVRNLFSKEDLMEKPLRSVLFVAALFSLSWFLLMFEGFVNVVVQGISWEEYGKVWSDSMRRTPIESRLFTLIVGSFTAGVFEEIIWRAYGITMLEDKYGAKIALIIQAVAFGVWHIQPIHAFFATIIGIVYGYIFIKRRRLLVLSLAHWLTDTIGFYFSLFL